MPLWILCLIPSVVTIVRIIDFLVHERIYFVLKIGFICLVDYEFPAGVFHLAEVHCVVFPVYQKVYLSSVFRVSASPTACGSLHSGYSQRGLDLTGFRMTGRTRLCEADC